MSLGPSPFMPDGGHRSALIAPAGPAGVILLILKKVGNLTPPCQNLSPPRSIRIMGQHLLAKLVMQLSILEWANK